MNDKNEKNQTNIQVTVTFPLAAKPFHGDYALTTSVGQVRSGAMADFGAAEEPNSVYYLTHGGDRLPDERALGEVADHARGLKFRLVKELVQG
jgi:hypothetical protein